MKPRLWVNPQPLTQLMSDVLHLLDFIFCTLSRVHVRNVNNGFLVRIQHLQNLIRIRARIKIITNVQTLQILIPIQLLIIRIRHGFKLTLILRRHHRLRIPAKIRPCHRHDMHLIPCHKLRQMCPQFIIRTRTHMMEFINRNQTAIKRLYPKLIHRKPKCRMSTDQNHIIRL